jgi:hypothetical protein
MEKAPAMYVRQVLLRNFSLESRTQPVYAHRFCRCMSWPKGLEGPANIIVDG